MPIMVNVTILNGMDVVGEVVGQVMFIFHGKTKIIEDCVYLASMASTRFIWSIS